MSQLALLCAMSAAAHAATDSQDATPASEGSMVIGDVNVDAKRDTAAASALPTTYAGGQVARGSQLGILGNQDIMDVPFVSTAYTEELIRNQQAESIGDVLDNDSSVRVASGFANQSQTFMIRGLPLNADDISMNGLYGITPRQIVSTDLLERVELLKGPSAFLNGVTPTGTGLGGNVNVITKRADDTPLRRLTMDISDDGRVGEHLDLGQRFGAEKEFGVRLNLSQREGDTGIDDESQRTKVFGLGLDYRGERLRLAADLGYQKQHVSAGRNSVFVSGLDPVPDAPSADTNYAPKWGSTDLEDTFGMLRGEYDLNDNWTVYAAGGYKHTRENGRYSSATVIDQAGTVRITGSSIPHDEDNSTVMAGLNGKFQTGPVSHKLNFGLAGIWTQQRNAFDFYSFDGYTTNLYHPQSGPQPTVPVLSGGDMHDPGITGKTFNRSAAVSDTLGFLDDRVLFTVGLRRQQIVQQNYAYGSGIRTGNYDKAITTPVYGLVFKATDQISLYANRIEGLAAGPTAGATGGGLPQTNAGQGFAPGRTRQVEAGIKLDTGNLGGNLAAFRIEKPNDGFSQDNGDGTATFLRTGKQINKGVELNVFGEPLPGLRLLGGVTWIHAELDGTAGGTNDGNRPIGVPNFQLNAGVDWDVPGLQGLALNARMLRTGGQYVDEANNQSIPTWNRFDVGARYGFKVAQKDVTLRATVVNVADKGYWASAQGGYLTQGEPRTMKLSASVDF